MGREVARDAMDIHGGKGIILGPRNYLGRGWQAAPIAITVEGANIMTRSLMIFGQGAILCHPWVLKEMKAAQLPDPDERLREFDTQPVRPHRLRDFQRGAQLVVRPDRRQASARRRAMPTRAATTASSTATRRRWR